jgi:ribonuclease E
MTEEIATTPETPAKEASTPPPAGSDGSDGASGDEAKPSGSGPGPRPRRRRRRGGSGRSGPRSTAAKTSGAGDGTDGDEPAEQTTGRPKTAATKPAETKTTEKKADAESPADGEPASDGQSTGPTRRRRRRGGRGRGRGRGTGQGAAESSENGDVAADEGAEPSTARAKATSTSDTKSGGKTAGEDKPKSGTGTRRRRGSGSSSTTTAKKSTAKSPARTAKTKSETDTAPPPTRTSKRPRLPGTRRRREPPPVTKRTRDKIMLITEHGDRDQIAVVEERDLIEHYITRVGATSMVGNIYLGRVQNVLPGMEAAFVDVGRGRNAVLYAGEVNWDEDVEGQARRIEQALKPGQGGLVQVTKDPMGGKGARLTGEISVPGRFLVLVPNSQVFGLSRRLPDNERRRLRTIVRKVKPEQHGIIVRTAAEGATEEDLAADVQRLVETWEDIDKRSKKAKPPKVLYEEPELTVRVVRDLFNDEEFKEIITDSRTVYDNVRAYLEGVAPDLVDNVHFHDGKLPLFEEHHLLEQIHKALERKVWLPSGGYIVIDRTEAMTVIDVNTGRHVGKTNLEETVVKTNIEAAEEIARQLRLRDIGGMIIIDFIDMLFEQNKEKVISTLKEAMAQDKTRSQVFDISPLGLLEVTRKRVSAGLLESFSETCPTCEGRGILITHEMR